MDTLKYADYLFTIEDHMLEGGLGSLIAENITETSNNTKIFRKGISEFVGSGKPLELEKKYGLDSDSIVQFILSKIKKWKN